MLKFISTSIFSARFVDSWSKTQLIIAWFVLSLVRMFRFNGNLTLISTYVGRNMQHWRGWEGLRLRVGLDILIIIISWLSRFTWNPTSITKRMSQKRYQPHSQRKFDLLPLLLLQTHELSVLNSLQTWLFGDLTSWIGENPSTNPVLALLWFALPIPCSITCLMSCIIIILLLPYAHDCNSGLW